MGFRQQGGRSYFRNRSRGESQSVAAHLGAQIFDSFTPVEDQIVTAPIQPCLPPTLDPNYIGTTAVQVVPQPTRVC